jgi:Holliday junction DNA helicase RuvA
MIAHLSGKLVAMAEDHIIVDVNGVGYLVYVGSGTLAQLPPLGSPVRIHTYLTVQDSEMRLYGFTEALQREIFETLLSVSGIGPKMALTIVSSLPTNMLLRAITQEDIALLTEIPGVGTKLAQRIALELRERIAHLGWRTEAAPTDASRVVIEEVFEALLQLGFTQSEARRAATLAVRQWGEDATTETALKAALQKLGGG